MSLSRLNIANILGYIVNTIVTFISVTGVFGKTNSEVSALYQTLITPAGFTFSIWGLIFTAELLFVVAQCSSAVRDSELLVKGVSYGWVSACVFQSLWSVAFAQELLVVSAVLITGILVSLAGIVRRSAAIAPLDSYDVILRLPLVLHFGWLVLATSLQFNILAIAQGASVPTQLAVALTSVALVLVLVVQVASVDFTGRAVTAGVAAWALIGIGAELNSPMDQATCEEETGGTDCNMISELFDADTILGVQKYAYTLAVLCAATVVIASAASLRSASTTTASKTPAQKQAESSKSKSALHTPLV